MSFHYQLENGTGSLQLESGSGDYLLEQIIGSSAVQATARGDCLGIFRDIGDVFLLTDPGQFSDSAVSQVPVGDPDYPIYGWMLSVPQNTPLYSFALANGGASTVVIASQGVNKGAQQVWGNAKRYVV